MSRKIDPAKRREQQARHVEKMRRERPEQYAALIERKRQTSARAHVRRQAAKDLERATNPQEPKPRTPKTFYSGTCVICGTGFESNQPKQITCGKGCRKAHMVNLVRVLRATRKQDAPRRRQTAVQDAAFSLAVRPKPKATPIKPPSEKPQCAQTPARPGCKSFQRQAFEECGVGPDWDRPRIPVAPLLVAPPFAPTVGANVVYSGPVIEKRVGDWRKGIF